MPLAMMWKQPQGFGLMEGARKSSPCPTSLGHWRVPVVQPAEVWGVKGRKAIRNRWGSLVNVTGAFGLWQGGRGNLPVPSGHVGQLEESWSADGWIW